MMKLLFKIINKALRVALALSVFFVLIILYATLIEPRWVQITRHETLFENYPAGAPPMKIAFMADFHCGPYMSAKRVRRIVDFVNRELPDAALLGGDFVSYSAKNADYCARELSRLNAKGGVFAVLGNHDYWEGGDYVAEALRRNGVDVLVNENRRLGEGVWLAALDDEWAGHPNPDAAFAGIPPKSARLALTHSPKLFPSIKDRDCLALAGHTHGGQIDIPGIPRNELPGLLNSRYLRGWYYDGNSRMYVNRGLSVVNPPMRFRARPEITILTLRRGTPDVSNMKVNEPIDADSRVRAFSIRMMRFLLR